MATPLVALGLDDVLNICDKLNRLLGYGTSNGHPSAIAHSAPWRSRLVNSTRPREAAGGDGADWTVVQLREGARCIDELARP